MDGQEETHTLGLLWHSKSGELKYCIKLPKPNKRLNKRSIVSTIAQIYDPLGLLGPTIIATKIILQKLWQLKISWDDGLPSDLANEWQFYLDNLHIINKLSVPHRVICDNYVNDEIHEFASAFTCGQSTW
ncbi:hypothetical protein ILUMI_26370 [Ignelater luminosus]|uniref:Uncharacterized protein n=1 Tax=Ignelater luminosus TaxID=2038154 RepID=A0A8K0FVY1_IGNLU|nr:hypothetical protein ILUMI_26370 [Ignelater luminosus]